MLGLKSIHVSKVANGCYRYCHCQRILVKTTHDVNCNVHEWVFWIHCGPVTPYGVLSIAYEGKLSQLNRRHLFINEFENICQMSAIFEALICKYNEPDTSCRDFADDIFKYSFLNENVWISLKISLKFVSKVRVNSIPALVQIMAWRQLCDKPLSKPYMRHSASMS